MSQIKLIAEELNSVSNMLENGLQALGVPYEILFKQDHPECMTAYGIGRFPCLLIDDRIAYHGPLAEPDLRLILSAFEPTTGEKAGGAQRARRMTVVGVATGAIVTAG